VTPAITAKSQLREQLRRIRRAVDDPAGRSERIWTVVRELPAVLAAATVMAYESIPGEPQAGPFLAWCRAAGKAVVLPEEQPAATVPDAGIVPGLAFTPDGHRLGQGGGWYDRFLAGVRDDCLTIGVAFAAQLVESLPVEPHDVTLDVIVTEAGIVVPHQGARS
jgi:5-formyltetrahydrofolate cyclo-ligase